MIIVFETFDLVGQRILYDTVCNPSIVAYLEILIFAHEPAHPSGN
jgi:hypothetical protein